MSNATTIDSLQLEITSSATSASAGIDNLTKSLEALRTATKGGIGLTSVVNQLNKLNSAAKSIDQSSINNINGLTKAIQTLSNLGGVKISSSIANQINAISNAFKNADFTSSAGKIQTLVSALNPLQNLGKTNLSGYVNTLKQLPAVFAQLGQVNMTGVSANIQNLVSALAPLGNMGKQNLSGYINTLKKLPDVVNQLNQIDMNALAMKIKDLANAFKPLADEMQKIANGFSALPAKIQKLISSTNNLTSTNNKAKTSYINLYAKIKMAIATITTLARKVAESIKLSSEYTETMNLFTVSMGKYAEGAFNYAKSVSEIMGIDPAEWMKNQGIFMTLAKGFGVAGDRAAVMSEQMTQLGYDLSSFFNITVEEAMTKIQSGISGELEPLRRIGYDLSQAKLEAVALSLGIDKTVASMTQAEKAELRYYAIMTQVTDAHGDMSRTLDAPANQLRIMSSQVTQLGRALGDLFIPMLNKVLPYLISLTKILREAVSAFGTFVGIEMSGVEWGADSIVSATEDVVSNLEDGQEEAKKLKSYMLGFDELNVLGGEDGGAEDVLGTGFNFELPEYDFLGEATSERIDKITNSIKGFFEPLTALINTTKDWAKDLNIEPIKVGFVELGKTLASVGKQIGDALGWVYEDILLPLSKWTLEEHTPAIIGMYTSSLGLLGAAFDPVIKGFKILMEDLQPIFDWIGEVVLTVIESFESLFGKIANVVKEKSPEITNIITGIGDILSAMWADLKPIADAALFVFDLLLDLFGDFVAIGWEYLIDMVSSFVDILAGLATGDWGRVWDGVVGIFEAGWNRVANTAKACWDFIVGLFTPIAQWFNTYVIQPIASFFTGLWNGIKTVAQACWNGIVTVFAPAINWFSNLFGSIKQTISDVFYNIGVIVSGCWTIVKTGATTAWTGIKAAFEPLVKWSTDNVVKPVTNAFSGIWEGLKSGAANAWNGVKYVFGTVGSFFRDTFTDAWTKVKNVFSVMGNVFVSIRDGIVNAFKSIVNGLIRGINSVISAPFKAINTALETIKNIEIVGIKPFKNLKTISVPQIPLLANGGFPNVGQLFVAREAGAEMVGNIGGRTAVMNNDQIVESVSAGVYQAVVAAMGGGNDDGDTRIVINLDGEKIYENQQKIARNRGYNLGMGAFSFG